MSSHPLRVLLVAEDRRLLRQLSRLLHAFGYHLQQVADKRQAAALLHGLSPELLIVDADPDLSASLELCRLASGPDRCGLTHTLLLLGEPTSEDVCQAVAAGVDDFLAKPVVYGELLVRLRAAAQGMEFERRLRERADIDPKTGLFGHAALHRRLTREGQAQDGRRAAMACLLADVDFLGRICRCHGPAVGERAVRLVVEALKPRCVPPAFLASLDHGLFAVLLPGNTEAEAAHLAEQLRQAVESIDWDAAEVPLRACEKTGTGSEQTERNAEKLRCREAPVPMLSQALRVTISVGVAAIPAAGTRPHQVLDRARAALQTAKQSGRNCVVRFGQFDEEVKAWAQLAAPGRLFERTLARDVMTPWTLAFLADQSLDAARALLRQARLEAAPVVDDCGRFAGVLLGDGSEDRPPEHGLRSHVGDVVLRDVSVCEEETPFGQLMECFGSDDCLLVAVTHQGQPTGYVSRASLASLGKPLTTESFASSEPYSLATDYLRVVEK